MMAGSYMMDLYLGIAIMLVLMAACFGLALRLTRSAPKQLCDILAVVTVLAIGYYARWIWDDTVMGQLLPFSNLVMLSNWFPLATGFLAGLVWRRIEGGRQSRPRQIFAVVLLGVAATYSLFRPLQGAVPVCANEWEGDLCKQTTKSSCSAAAAATLLQFYDLYAPEQEMAELCLTRINRGEPEQPAQERHLLIQALQTRSGTTWKGLYRGLSLKAREIGYRAEVFESDYEQLRRSFEDPCILQCELQMTNDGSTADYEAQGWVPGQPHSIVLWNFNEDGTVVVGDPFAGPEVWPREAMETLWQGQTLRLVRRDDADEQQAAAVRQ